MYIHREIETTLLKRVQEYPVVVVTGPRQAGKTTLVRKVFPQKEYVSLEEIDNREFAHEDPRGFIQQYSPGAIFDEIQHTPDLLSYLQSHVDETNQMGMYILTGSQHLGLLSSVTQTLAGRAALITLLPFSFSELTSAQRTFPDFESLLFTGSYPPVYDRKLEPSVWYGNYVRTYVERDVRQMVNVRDLSTFQTFLRLCAGRIGQLVNLSALANECGVTHNTAKSWLSVLEASYIVYTIKPYFKNFNKRLVKTPKLCFTDTGVAAWLLKIRSKDYLTTHPLRGELFENWVISELHKRYHNSGMEPNLYFWRDRTGNEVDVIIDKEGVQIPVEVKSGKTVSRDYFKGIGFWNNLTGEDSRPGLIVYGGDREQKRNETTVIPWRRLSDNRVISHLVE